MKVTRNTWQDAILDLAGVVHRALMIHRGGTVTSDDIIGLHAFMLQVTMRQSPEQLVSDLQQLHDRLEADGPDQAAILMVDWLNGRMDPP